MPDPTQPIPPNFLRSQTALLGTAGLVSRLNPASFKVQQPRGNSSRNPIVIREDHRPPTQQKFSIAEHLSALNLPTPTTREIVYALIKEKNIFPVLANILKLVGRGAFKPSSSRSSTQEPQSEDQRPSKRRKLRTVPAGAADWDTPFPFKEGEGPEWYRANWERERGKQLISELVSIIKTATCKAAAKSFVQKEPEVFSHLSAKGSSILKDSTVNNAPVNNSPVTQDSEQPNDLSDLLTSLLSAQNEVPKSYGEEQTSSALFDSWMSIFQAFPQPSTPDDPFAFLSAPELPFQNTSGLEQGNIENPAQPLDPALEPPSTFADGSFFMDQSGVDPSLLALSIPTFSESSSAWSSYPSSSMASPLHDTFGELEAFTPTSSVWTGDNASALDPSTSQTALPSDNPAFFNDLPGETAVKPSTAPPLNKEEVIRLAVQRRKQLAEDLVKARTQLWETTIEQGVLAHLVKTIR